MGRNQILSQIEDLVADTIVEFNRQLPADKEIASGMDVIVLGEGGTLDSLSVINLLIAVEQNVQDRCGCYVDLLAEATGENGSTNLATVQGLVDFITLHVEIKS